MANIYRGVFDFEIRGADAIAELERHFQTLGMRVDLVRDTVIEGGRAMERASARLHGIRRNEMIGLENLINLANAYAVSAARAGQFSTQAPIIRRPGMVQGQIGTLTGTGNNVRDSEQARRERERLNREAFQSWARGERQRLAAEARHHAATLRVMQEAARLRERFVRQRLDHIDSIQRAEMRATQQQLSDVRMRNRETLAESRRLLREQQANLRTARRHIDNIARYSNDTLGQIRFPILRVFAFDMLRRMFTNMYQMVAQVGDKLVQWTVESIKFNDELKRSETFFTSLGLLGIKGAQGGQITVAEARTSGDKNVQDIFNKSTELSRRMMENMMAISAETGQDLEEVVGSTRQATTDLLNKLVAKGQKNPFINNPEVFEDVTNRMVRLATVLRMSDPGNRKLSFHMVGLQELFSGSSEGKKDTGLANVMSLMRREGIKVGKDYASQITKLVNAGKLKEAMDVVELVMTRSGLGLEQISNFMTETLQPAIDGTIMFLRLFAATFTGPLYDNLRFFFQELVQQFKAMKENEAFMEMIRRLGRVFNEILTPHLQKVMSIIDNITSNPEDFERSMGASLETFRQGLRIAIGLLQAAGLFILGFFEGPDGGGLSSAADQMQQVVAGAREAGQRFRSIVDFIVRNFETIFYVLVGSRILAFIADIIYVMVSFGAAINAAAAAGIPFAIMLRAIPGMIMRGIGFIVGGAFRLIRAGVMAVFRFVAPYLFVAFHTLIYGLVNIVTRMQAALFGAIRAVFLRMLPFILSIIINPMGVLRAALLGVAAPIAALTGSLMFLWTVMTRGNEMAAGMINWVDQLRARMPGFQENQDRKDTLGIIERMRADKVSEQKIQEMLQRTNRARFVPEIAQPSAQSAAPVTPVVAPTAPKKPTQISINTVNVQAENTEQLKNELQKVAQAAPGMGAGSLTAFGYGSAGA